MVTLFPNLIQSSGNFKFVRNFYEQDQEAAEVFVLICYVHSCGVPISFDMIYSYLGDKHYTYKQMYGIIERAGGLVKNYDDTLISAFKLQRGQDYYKCRSRFLAEKIISSTISHESLFGDVLFKFASDIPTFKICAYDIFRRNGYDADWAFKAFVVKRKDANGNIVFDDRGDGQKYYSICAENDDSEYIYQQAALYFSKMKKYKLAYEWIDKAKNIANYDRFSINNTEAQIKFDANFTIDDAYDELVNSLNIMHESCKSDKRRHIHFCAFAEYAMRFFNKFNDDVATNFLVLAHKYVKNALEEDNARRISRDTKRKLIWLDKSILRLGY
jgi:hypothetical protein